MLQEASIKFDDKTFNLPVVVGSEQEQGIDVSKLRSETGLITLDDGRVSILRMLTYLPGLPLSQSPRTAAQRRALGGVLARMDLALRDFTHPAADHELLWNVAAAHRLKDMVEYITDAPRRAMIERFMAEYEASALPRLRGLRAQVIHNDFNLGNVLVDPDRTDVPAGARRAAAGEMRRAARKARDAVENQQVPRRYRDLIQRVFDHHGHDCGAILWESKRTKNWSNKWLSKAIDDQQEAKAACACIVTAAMPEAAYPLKWVFPRPSPNYVHAPFAPWKI